MNNLQIEQVNYSEAKLAIKAIRVQVFQEEQKVSEELEFDGLDETSIQLLAYLDSKPVGTARIRDVGKQTAKIERLAVLSEARGNGIGKKLMEAALEVAVSGDYQTVLIHAQEYIKELYLRLGFVQMGDTFEEANIPHVKMIKRID
jgi:predicted GNAT family N-acyltransferase